MVPTACFLKYTRQVDTIKYPALAATLKRIAKNGRDEYKGDNFKISSFSKYKDGNMTLEDLSQYEAKWRAPITFTYKDLKLLLCTQRRILFEPNNENDRAF
jgi:gamma-glutamyltranspeptidase/glutathione hydrolase